ncbi:MAG TPA: ELWxxDGT repeat protein [Phycisphaerales bacterium]|nr:ELWxxDGT repeat protein [Phycisphaerales bacterium]
MQGILAAAVATFALSTTALAQSQSPESVIDYRPAPPSDRPYALGAAVQLTDGMLGLFQQGVTTSEGIFLASDGTAAGTQPLDTLLRIRYTSGTVLPQSVRMGTYRAFTMGGNTGSFNTDVYITDGTAANTFQAFRPTSTLPLGTRSNLAATDTHVFWLQDGYELMTSQTAPNTTRSLVASPTHPVVQRIRLDTLNGRVFFPGVVTGRGVDIWTSDGTPEGTAPFFDLPATQTPVAFFTHQQFMYIFCQGGAIYRTDGNPANVTQYRAPTVGARLYDHFVRSGDWFYFVEVADGSSNGSLFAINGVGGVRPMNTSGFNFVQMVQPTADGFSLQPMNGGVVPSRATTTFPNTIDRIVRLHPVDPAVSIAFSPFQSETTSPMIGYSTPQGDRVVFVGRIGSGQEELFTSAGNFNDYTRITTINQPPLSGRSPRPIARVNDRILFRYFDAAGVARTGVTTGDPATNTIFQPRLIEFSSDGAGTFQGQVASDVRFSGRDAVGSTRLTTDLQSPGATPLPAEGLTNFGAITSAGQAFYQTATPVGSTSRVITRTESPTSSPIAIVSGFDLFGNITVAVPREDAVGYSAEDGSLYVHQLQDGERRLFALRPEGTTTPLRSMSDAYSLTGVPLKATGDRLFYLVNDVASGTESVRLEVVQGSQPASLLGEWTLPSFSFASSNVSLGFELPNGNIVVRSAFRGTTVGLALTGGTPQTTQTMLDLPLAMEALPGPWFTVLNGRGYFAARVNNGGVFPAVLHETDGTVSGTRPVEGNVPALGLFSPVIQTPTGPRFAFFAETAAMGTEMHLSDGTAVNTTLLKDIWPGPQSSRSRAGSTEPYTSGYLATATHLFFVANDGTHGFELWTTDGTPQGTRMVADLWPGSISSSPQLAGIYNNRLLFTARTPTQGREYWMLPLDSRCDDIDFNNNDVFPEDQDVVDFFNVLAGADCPACNDIDFNNNGVFPEDQDVIDFFNVLAGGQCL